MKPFLLTIVTPQKKLLEKEVFQATLPIQEGEITILAEHEPYIGACQAGEILIRSEKGEEHFALSGGFVEFHNERLVVLADRAEAAVDIDLERAEEAKRRAEDLMQQTDAVDQEAYQRTVRMLEKEANRIRIARRRRHL